MTDPKVLAKQYLTQQNVMQLATVANNQPWACTVHFYADEDMNLYWISKDFREHSKHIAANPKVAATVLVHENTPKENYVIGLSFAGGAEIASQQTAGKILPPYMSKLAKDPAVSAGILAGEGTDKLYCLKPSRGILFDTRNFPNSPRQEIFGTG